MLLGADIERITAPNPGPMTLEGTNSYLVGRDPAVLIDPGPADEGHVAGLREAAGPRGGIGAVLLTHFHGDHADGLKLLDLEPAGPGADGMAAGLRSIPTPGHSADHVAFALEPGHPAAGDARGPIVFAGDLIAGQGSTFVPPSEHGGSLADYLDSLRRVIALEPEIVHPGHGPVIEDPAARLSEQLEHRLMRERRLLEALDRGERSREALLEEVWDDAPPELRGAAMVTMQSHLEKLAGEGRLPGDLRE